MEAHARLAHMIVTSRDDSKEEFWSFDLLILYMHNVQMIQTVDTLEQEYKMYLGSRLLS